MKISVYMETIAYKYGGAEAYTANLISFMQKQFPEANIALITEHLKNHKLLTPARVAEMQNLAYGTNIQSENFSVAYFSFEKIEEQKSKNKLSRIFRIIKKEIYANYRFKKIKEFSKDSDLFINCSFNIISGIGKKNICIVHFPRTRSCESGINKRIPWFRKQAEKRDSEYGSSYDLYLPNSFFTASNLKERWKATASRIKVLYPPVKSINGSSKKVFNQILLCSRICKPKKIDLILSTLTESEFLKQNAKIVLAGSAVGEDESFISYIRNNFPLIELHLDPTREDLEKLYLESSFFVHAMGLNETSPEKFEHFGITTVEAMSAGCVPVVIDKGGQKEIVTDGTGFRWNSLEELVERTEWLIKNPDEAEKIRLKAIERSRFFTNENFETRLKGILSEVTCA
ncbi:MAG: glycosyltransferase [Treponema sp.]|nr:glycosyltransferase [Treponema sp.]